MNLFTVYKSHYIRARNAPWDETKAEIASLAKTFWETDKSQQELLTIAEEIASLESQLPRLQTLYGPSTVRSIRAGDYTIDVPYQIRHRYNDKTDGYIYVMVSPDRPGQCKLGATTLTVAKRCMLYRSKYGYSVEEHFSTLMEAPFRLEKAVARKAAPYRVSGLTDGDSNEWYNLEPETLANMISETSEQVYF